MADDMNKNNKNNGADDSSTTTTTISSSYILVEWSINKIFTVLQNFKKVQLNELVTCKVNNTKDVGKVIFIGTQAECNTILENYKNKKLAKKNKAHKHKSHRSKLNFPIVTNRPSSINSSTSNLNNALHHDEFLKPKVNKYSQKFRSVENELNTIACDNEVANITKQQQQQQQQSRSDRNKPLIDFHSIDPGGMSIRSSNERSATDTTTTTNTTATTSRSNSTMNINVNVCHECECCRVWEREFRSLIERMRVLEAAYSLTPEVVNWFDKLKSVIRPHMELSDFSSLSVSNVSLNQLDNNNNSANNPTTTNNNELNGGATKSSDTIVGGPSTTTTSSSNNNNNNAPKTSNDKSAVPEIVIENIV